MAAERDQDRGLLIGQDDQRAEEDRALRENREDRTAARRERAMESPRSGRRERSHLFSLFGFEAETVSLCQRNCTHKR